MLAIHNKTKTKKKFKTELYYLRVMLLIATSYENFTILDHFVVILPDPKCDWNVSNKLSPTTVIVQDPLLTEHLCCIGKHWLTMVCVSWLSISRTGQRLGIWTTWGYSGMFPQTRSFRWQIDSWRSFYSPSSTDCKPSWKEKPWIGEGCKLSSLFSSTERDYTVMLQAVLPQLIPRPPRL